MIFVGVIFGLCLVPFAIHHTLLIKSNKTTIESFEKHKYRMGSSGEVMQSRVLNVFDLGKKYVSFIIFLFFFGFWRALFKPTFTILGKTLFKSLDLCGTSGSFQFAILLAMDGHFPPMIMARVCLETMITMTTAFLAFIDGALLQWRLLSVKWTTAIVVENTIDFRPNTLTHGNTNNSNNNNFITRNMTCLRMEIALA